MKKITLGVLMLLWLFTIPASAEWQSSPFDFRATAGVGMSINGDATGFTTSGVFGSLYSVDYLNVERKEQRKMIELGTLDIGVGSRFGNSNEGEGNKYTLHLGPGGCVYQIACVAYVYAVRLTFNEIDTDPKPWRPNIVLHAGEVGRLLGADKIPWIGEIFK